MGYYKLLGPLLVAVLAVCLLPSTFALSEHHYAEETVEMEEFCTMPEVGDAASTRSTKMKAVHLKQNYEECKEDLNAEFRTADGSCNHPLNLGQAGTPPRRLLENAYDDGVNDPRCRDADGEPLPSATNISRTVHPRNDVNQRFTIMLMQWGQFMDHDVTGFPISSEEDETIRCCGENGEVLKEKGDRECFPIYLTPEDIDVRFRGECMEFARSIAARDKFGKKLVPREPVNSVTAFMDASMVYGSSEELQLELREEGDELPSFLLRTSKGGRLPPNPEENCRPRPGDSCFLAGDTRVNEQPGLIAIHTLFVRLHNQIATELDSVREMDTDEQIFQLTRKIVSAIIQHIHYNEWLPIIIGRRTAREFSLLPGNRTGYIPSIDPRITNVFSTAAFRLGHTLIPKEYIIDGNPIRLREMFSRPDVIIDFGVDKVLKALTRPFRRDGAQAFDRFFTEEITGHLFEEEIVNDEEPSGGVDLVALNIQRGRDHGLPPYNEYRKFCGLPPLKSFDDLPAHVAQLFQDVYRSVDDIDAFPGMMSEPRERGQLAGPTIACIVANQFHALKFGDRFFYETDRMPEGFNDDQLKAIRKITMAHVLCQSGGFLKIQRKAFEVVLRNNRNDYVRCSDLQGSNFLDIHLFEG